VSRRQAGDEIVAFVAFVAAEHTWARPRAVTVRDLIAESFLTREAASCTRAVATAALARAGVELTPALQAASAQSLKRALAGGGFTLISRVTIEAEEPPESSSACPCVASTFSVSFGRSVVDARRSAPQLARSGAGRHPHRLIALGGWLAGS